jgi:hypothetical protein
MVNVPRAGFRDAMSRTYSGGNPMGYIRITKTSTRIEYHINKELSEISFSELRSMVNKAAQESEDWHVTTTNTGIVLWRVKDQTGDVENFHIL